jgi:hypothetical protein
MTTEQPRIKVEAGVDDLCDILDVAERELKDELSGWADHVRARLLPVLRDLDRQINAGGTRNDAS